MIPLSFVILSIHFSSVLSATNVTVDINDDRIVKTGSWSQGTIPGASVSCGSWTNKTGDSATLSFSGSVQAVYVNGDITPDPNSVQAILDGEALTPNPAGPPVCNENLFTQTGLIGSQHTLVLTFVGPASSADGQPNSMVIQNIVYTVEDPTSSTSMSASSASSVGLSSASDSTSTMSTSTTPSTAMPSTSASISTTSSASESIESTPTSLGVVSSTTSTMSTITAEISPSSITTSSDLTAGTSFTSSAFLSTSEPSTSATEAFSIHSTPFAVAAGGSSASALTQSALATITPSTSTFSVVTAGASSIPTPSPITTGMPATSALSSTPSTGPVALTSSTSSSSTPTPSALTAGSPLASSGRVVSKGVIAGAVVGGLLLVSVPLVFLNAEYLNYSFYSLIQSLFGAFKFPFRRIIFRAGKDLPRTEITLVLTNRQGKAEKSKVLYRVFHIGGQEKDFILDIPCNEGGSPALGFATIEIRDDETINWVAFSPGRTVLRTSINNTLTFDQDQVTEPESDDHKNPLYVQNNSGIPTRLALGTYDEGDQVEDGKKPFFPFSVQDLRPDDKYEPDTDLFIHTFRTNGCKESGYGNWERKLQDRVTPPSGYELGRLRPITEWCFSQGKTGLNLEIGTPRRQDIKQYMHQCKIRDAYRDGRDRS